MNFISKVNDVKLTQIGGRRFIRKAYGTKAFETGIQLPLSRSKVEYRILNRLPELTPVKAYGVKFPRVNRFIEYPAVIEMEYIIAGNLRQTSSGNLPDAHHFYQLGRFLKAVQELDMSDVTQIFTGLEEVSKRSSSAMLRYKVPSYLPDETERFYPTLCLGDLTLSNILSDGGSIYLIDFEFAHVGYVGFDAGQLLAEMESSLVGRERSDIPAALREGFSKRNKFSQQCERWKNEFLPYYKRKYQEAER